MDTREMNDTLPNLKIGESVTNIFQNNNLTFADDADSSFVVLARNVVESSPKHVSTDNESPQKISGDLPLVASSTNTITRIERKLQEMSAENLKLKNTLEESDTIMKQQFEKIEVWQKEVMSISQNHNQKYTKTKQLIDMIKAENEYLRGLVKNEPESSLTTLSADTEQNCINTESINSLANIENELHKMLEKNKDLREHSEKLVAHHKDFVSFFKNPTKLSLESKEQINEAEALNNLPNSKIQDQLLKVIDPPSPTVSNKCEDIALEPNLLNKLTDLIHSECKVAEKDVAAKALTTSPIRERESSLGNNMMVISLTSVSTTQIPAAEIECVSLEKEPGIAPVYTQSSIETKRINAENQLAMVTSKFTEQTKETEKNASIELKLTMAKALKEVSQNENETETLKTYQEALQLPISIIEQEKLKTCDLSASALTDNETRTKYAEVGKKLKEWNEMLSKERASLVEQQIKINEEKALVHAKLSEVMTGLTTLNKEKEILAIERKAFQDIREAYHRQEQLHTVEKSMLKKEILLVRQKCEQLAQKIKELEAENEVIQMSKKDILLERESLEELQKLLNDEMKSHQEEHASVIRENTLLKSKCDMLEEDLKNFNTELIGTCKMITKLRNENTELRKVADAVETYKVQNDVQAKDILHMFNVEQNYLAEIERLTNENEKLREENRRLKDQSN